MASPTKVDQQLALAFAPLDKRALGVALGATIALLTFVATALSIVLDPEQRFPLYLLQQYFYGYQITWPGAVVGAFWGFAVGFAWGWFAAFARNLVLAVWLMTIRIRADFSTSRDFLDHL
jgi:hypothetical protein